MKIMQNNYCPTRRSLLLYSKISAGAPQTVGLDFFTVIEGHQGKVHDILAAQLRAMQGAGSNLCMSLSTGLGKQELQPLGGWEGNTKQDVSAPFMHIWSYLLPVKPVPLLMAWLPRTASEPERSSGSSLSHTQFPCQTLMK